MTSGQCHSYLHRAFIHAHLPTHFITLLHNLMWLRVHCYEVQPGWMTTWCTPHRDQRGHPTVAPLSSLTHQATSITCHSFLALGLSSTTSTGWRGHTLWGGHLARSYTGREVVWHPGEDGLQGSLQYWHMCHCHAFTCATANVHTLTCDSVLCVCVCFSKGSGTDGVSCRERFG